MAGLLTMLTICAGIRVSGEFFTGIDRGGQGRKNPRFLSNNLFKGWRRRKKCYLALLINWYLNTVGIPPI